MAEYRIKDWKKYQHYTKRNPPWVKLHKTLLDDPDFYELDADASKLLVLMWLVASEHGGILPRTKRLAFRLRKSEAEIKSALSKLSHWVEHDASTMLADRYHNATPETESETETEKTLHQSDGGEEVKKKSKAATEEEFNQFWQAYPRKVGKKAAQRSFARALKDTTLVVIMGALAIDAPTWSEERFTPHPTTWLNEGRYLDRVQTNGQARTYRPPGWTEDDDRKLREHYANQPKDPERPTTKAEDLLDESPGVHQQNRH